MADYFSSDLSMISSLGQAEYDGLIADDAGNPDSIRFEKAAAQAQDEIETVLRTAGYIVPVEFTPFGSDAPVGGPAGLPAKLQDVSDTLTAWFLGSRGDLQKKLYEERAKGARDWLEQVRTRKLRLGLTQTDKPTGAGMVKTVARPQTLKACVPPPCVYLGRNDQ
jgi:hypothetical protein